LRWM
jgi:hypothetical protein